MEQMTLFSQYDIDRARFVELFSKFTGISRAKLSNYLEKNPISTIFEHPSSLEISEEQRKRIKELIELRNLYHNLKGYVREYIIDTPDKAGAYFKEYFSALKDKEYFVCSFLDNGFRVIVTKVLSEGCVDQAAVYPREIAKLALLYDARSIIMAHNHPGGSMRPSSADIDACRKVEEALSSLNISVLDKIIVADGCFFSFAENGMLSRDMGNRDRNCVFAEKEKRYEIKMLSNIERKGENQMIDAELIIKARNADLLEYLKAKGYALEKSGAAEYRLKEHDSLVISNNKWHWKSRDIGGNTLDFLIKYEGKKLPEAVKELLGMDLSGGLHADAHAYSKREPKTTKELELPAKAESYSRAFAYLTKTRKIDGRIVSDMMKQGKIYESERHNCVFTGSDNEGTIRFACERGTLTCKPYKRDCPGSDKRFCFAIEGKSGRAYVFESPIDAMSHATICKRAGGDYTLDHRISLSGVEPIALMKYLEDRRDILEVILCLDNDNAGREASKRIAHSLAEKGYSVRIEPPNGKDYNEDLVNMPLQKEKELSRTMA